MSAVMSGASPAGVVRVPHAWSRLIVGFFLLAGACGGWVFLLQQYLAARPVDLRENAVAAADAVVQTLLDNQVPKTNLRRGVLEQREDETALWCMTAFEVELPEAVGSAGLARVLAQDLARYQVTTAETLNEGQSRLLRMSIAGKECVTVLLNTAPPPAPPPRQDYTGPCRQLADLVAAFLESRGFSPDQITRSAPEPNETEQATWCLTRFEVRRMADTVSGAESTLRLPPPENPASGIATVEALSAALQETITQPEARVMTRLGLGGQSVIAIERAGAACVEIILARADLTAPPRPEPLAESGVKLNGRMDAEPVPEPPAAGDISEKEENLQLDSTGVEEMELGRKLTGVTPPGGTIPRVAIVVDDAGYGGPITEHILELDPGLTLAVLPGTPFDETTTRRAQQLGFEVILHMPMDETHIAGQITKTMSEPQLREHFDKALQEIPGAAGFNNHMGSEFTADATALNRLFGAIKHHNLYFVDSRTTANTKAFDTARRLGIRTGSRDVFLDNESDPGYIRKQFRLLMDVAKEQGQAIGICHFRTTTAQALAELIPELKKNGIQLVHTSEIVQ